MGVSLSKIRHCIMATHTFHEQFPLPSDEQSIRVLCIQPGVRGTTIEASLSKIDLNDPKRAPYTTLSYTWGDAAIVDYVLVNDEKIGVGVNLFQALQHIRSPNEPIVIWVDAICIDQADDTEKSHQVSHMGLVYRLCKQVYIWLGSPDDSYPIESNPFAFIEHMAANKTYIRTPRLSQRRIY
ncbi:HET-domain-containing protein [Alternaria alternata]|nr:HET-domain-containing protein [Alternaria alternata]